MKYKIGDKLKCKAQITSNTMNFSHTLVLGQVYDVQSVPKTKIHFYVIGPTKYGNIYLFEKEVDVLFDVVGQQAPPSYKVGDELKCKAIAVVDSNGATIPFNFLAVGKIYEIQSVASSWVYLKGLGTPVANRTRYLTQLFDVVQQVTLTQNVPKASPKVPPPQPVVNFVKGKSYKCIVNETKVDGFRCSYPFLTKLGIYTVHCTDQKQLCVMGNDQKLHLISIKNANYLFEPTDENNKVNWGKMVSDSIGSTIGVDEQWSPKCECGAHKCGHKFHSTWCSLNGKD
jgi:hypothetical protein